MSLRLLRVCILLAIAQMPLAVHAQPLEYNVGAIKIVHPWMRMPPAAAKVAGGFMTLTNTGTSPDRLIGGTVVNAARVEVHEMSVVDGVMRMRQLQTGLEIKPGETVVLKPGSYHVMVLDLQKSPREGTNLKGTLVFEKAGAVEIEYKVEAAGGSSSGERGGKAGKGSGSGSGSGSGAGSNANQ
jgi:periplasmic copper chaperone A